MKKKNPSKLGLMINKLKTRFCIHVSEALRFSNMVKAPWESIYKKIKAVWTLKIHFKHGCNCFQIQVLHSFKEILELEHTSFLQ